MDDFTAGLIATAGFIFVAALAVKPIRKIRRWQVRPINQSHTYQSKGQYQYFLNMKAEDPDQFFKYTRMDKATFDVLLQKIKQPLTKVHRRAIPAEMKLAITLQYLSQGNSLQKDAWGFQIGHSTVWSIVYQVCQVICDKLMAECLPQPTKEDWLQIAGGFKERWNLPHCIGAVDGKHIVMQSPKNSGTLFHNHKRTFSLVLMAVVDDDYNFRVVDIGSCGSENDAGIFSDTALGKAIINETLQQEMNVPEDSLEPGIPGPLPYYIVGDDAFPLKKNLMKPFGGRNLIERNTIYNYRISRARRIVENAFGILAARWRIFRSSIIATPERVEIFTLAAVILHNFIRSRESARKCLPRYVPPGYVDTEGPDGVEIPGAYRNDDVFMSNMKIVSSHANNLVHEITRSLPTTYERS